uniref:Uncharacterized protein n=1 Tax=Spyridia filamentosa TaxID=196632 RepID=A0A1Z1MJR4_SPYFI|nr:hypothetical protein [Spyridia filamentosa]ARW66186.1 hypothetical protein [Spyridia filamentosa]
MQYVKLLKHLINLNVLTNTFYCFLINSKIAYDN